MGEFLREDNMGATIADLDRRLRVMESTARVGLNRVRYAWSTHASGAAPSSTMDAYEGGPAGSTWADDEGATGTGYPTVTLTLGSKALFLCQAIPRDIANDAAYKAGAFRFGPAPDGLTPESWGSPYPIMYGGGTHGATSEGTPRYAFIVGRNDITPGEHTVKINMRWVTQFGGAALPSAHDIFLAVVPIN